MKIILFRVSLPEYFMKNFHSLLTELIHLRSIHAPGQLLSVSPHHERLGRAEGIRKNPRVSEVDKRNGQVSFLKKLFHELHWHCNCTIRDIGLFTQVK